MYIMNLKYLRVNYALFIRRFCLHVFVRRPSTKCPRDKMAGDEMSRDETAGDEVSRRRSVQATKCPATKRLAPKCPGDEKAGDEAGA